MTLERPLTTSFGPWRYRALLSLIAVILSDASVFAGENSKQTNHKGRPAMNEVQPQLMQRWILNAMTSVHRGVVPAKKSTGDSRKLVLQVVFDQRPYLLAEPILVHCLLINETGSDVTIPYSYWNEQQSSKIRFHIQASGAKEVERLLQTIPLGRGTTSVTIPSGHQFVHTIDLRHDYAIVDPGKYDLTVEYNTDGKYCTFEPKTKRYIEKHGWTGRLTKRVGELVIHAPKNEQDKAALKDLRELSRRASSAVDATQYAFLYDVAYADQDASESFVERYPTSQYADYVRLHSAVYHLEQFRLSDTKKLAQIAVDRLEAIDVGKHSTLVKEWVLYQRIQARLGAGESDIDLRPQVERFKKEFPDSPYILALDEILSK